MHMIDVLVQPAIFMSLYYTLTLPEIKFVDYYLSESQLHHSSPTPFGTTTSLGPMPGFPAHPA